MGKFSLWKEEYESIKESIKKDGHTRENARRLYVYSCGIAFFSQVIPKGSCNLKDIDELFKLYKLVLDDCVEELKELKDMFEKLKDG